MQACLSAGKVRQCHFHTCRGLVKLVQAHFSVRKDRESSLQHSGGAEELVQACLSAGKVQQSHVHHSGGPVKPVEVGLSARNNRESSFHNSGSLV